MCGELWSGRGEQEGRMLGEGRGGEFQEGERWGVTRSLITIQAVKTLQLVIDARWRTLGCKALLITPDFHNGAQCAQMAPLNRILPLFQK